MAIAPSICCDEPDPVINWQFGLDEDASVQIARAIAKEIEDGP